MTPTAKTRAQKSPNGRSKSEAILASAISVFGEDGYETTKWSSVAERVGIGQTALYHYFESKAHCLLTIMQLQLERNQELFIEATKNLPPKDALSAAIDAAYTHDDMGVLQTKILHRHMDLLAYPRTSEREEEVRIQSRNLIRQIEANWNDLIQQGMDSGDFETGDSALNARIVLGLVLSTWNWYNPRKGAENGGYTLEMLSHKVQADALKVLQPSR